jgi:glycosyltransferase involved in cell wall biosynthesis
VLAMMAPLLPGLEAVGVMLDLLETDAMFGSVIPRVKCSRGCCIQTLASHVSCDSEWMPHAAIAELPFHTFPGDLIAPASLLRTVLLTEFGESDAPFTTLAATVVHRMKSARRSGFRTLVSNRAAVTQPNADCACQPPQQPPLPVADSRQLQAFDNDSDRSWKEFRGASNASFERLTARHLVALRGGRPSLLLDMRNLGATYNGTSFAALGAAQALHSAATDWDVAIFASEHGASFHDFESRFPHWPVYTSQPPSGFNVALRLSQPWHIQEMIDLHRAARVNAYLMLDTICWDVVYIAPPYLDGTWQFLSATADSLLFISEFSRQRFRARFPSAQRTSDIVCRLSFDPSDYVRADLIDTSASDYLLVIGNHLEHKDVPATTELLASAFPLMRIETLGPTRWQSRRVTSHRSGHLAEQDVQELYAGARLAVFPSFYEGFGLPVVTALAYGRTLLARSSELLDEIAARCTQKGRLITYRERDELVEHIGTLLNGGSVPTHPLGTALDGDRPRSWKDVGLQIEQALRQMMKTASTPTWQTREQLIAQAIAYRG